MFVKEHWYALPLSMRKEVINVQHEEALVININHSRIRAMRLA